MSEALAIPDAIAVLTNRARAVRALFGQWEQETYGREWSVNDLMSGFVVDVGDLTRLVMAATGRREEPDVSERIAHELADCLWSVLVLADRLEIDLGTAFEATMADLETILDARLTPDPPANLP